MAPHTRTQPLAHPVPPSLYRLTRLLLPHYAPTTGKASAPQTLEDLVSLVVNQPAAAAALLTHTPALATMPTVVKLLRLLLLTTLHGGVGGVVGAQAADLLACLDEADEPPAREAPLPPAALTALCGAMAALIDAAGPQLAAHADARRALYKAFTSEAIESLNTAALGVPSAQRALQRVLAWLPADAAPGDLSEDGLLHKIATQLPNADASELAPMLQCACAWEQGGALVDSLIASLAGATDAAGAKRGRKGRGGGGGAVVEMPQVVALRVLWTALDTPSTRASLLGDQRAKLADSLVPALKTLAGAPAADAQSVSLLALTCYLQLTWHLHDGKDAAADDEAASDASLAATRGAISDAMGWAAAASPAAAMGGAVNPQAALALSESGANVALTPGEARPRTRPRTAASPSADDGADSPMAAKTAAAATGSGGGLAARQLVCAWLAEASCAGVVDGALAGAATKFVGETLTLCGAGGNSAASLAPVLLHASKLSLHLLDLGATHSQCVPLALGLVEAAIGAAAHADEPTRLMRSLLLDALAILAQNAADEVKPFLKKLLDGIVSAMPPAAAPPTADVGGGVAALGLPPLPAETLDVLIRSSAAAPELLPAVTAVVRAAGSAAFLLAPPLRLLLACDQLHRPELPGRSALCRALMDPQRAAADDEADDALKALQPALDGALAALTA